LLNVAILAAGLVTPAGAQLGERDDTPYRMPNLSCQNWNAQVRQGQPQVMAQLAGIWRSRNIIPATPGVMQATPEDITMTSYSSGQMVYEKSACFAPPPPPPGMPPLQGRCAKAIGHGGWYAYQEPSGWIFVGMWMQGSSYTGEQTPPNCSGSRVRLLDANHIVNEYGGQSERVGQVP
jgi:hypothetical protein